MAARENQGLQIALIIFVMLTIMLSVSTFIFFKKFKEEKEKIADYESRTAAAEKERDAKADELAKIKPMIGHPPDAHFEQLVQKAFDEDKKLYGALGTQPAAKPAVPPPDPDAAADGDAGNAGNDPNVNYRALLARLKAELDKRGGEVATHVEGKKKLEETNVANRAADKARVDAHEKGQKDAETQLAGERDKFNQDRETAKKNVATIAKAQQDAMKRQQEAQTKLEEEQKRAAIELTKANVERSDLAAQVKATRRETFDQSDGEITWVVQRDRLALINLGSADGIRPQVTFSVFAGDANRLIPTESKGKIEVTRVIGPNSAEARILEDSLANPILPKDKIFSPLWHPGRKTHVAIAGKTDLNGDGVSDRQRVRDLVLSNGGIIDAEVLDDGKRVGKLTAETRYLILGDEPTDAAGADALNQFSNIGREADRLGVQQMNLQQFLDMMGYKAEERTVELGRGANPRDFRAKPTDKAKRTKPEFRERKPPARGSKGAY